jgi:hypothetical protein
VCVSEQSENAPVCFAECAPAGVDGEHCSLGQRCVPSDAGPFACLLPTRNSGYAEECVYQTDCNSGLNCAPAAAVPGCDTPTGRCCTPYCDTSDALAAQGCPGFDEGQSCTAFFSTPPEGYENVGICTL